MDRTASHSAAPELDKMLGFSTASAPRVEALRQGTTLHKIVMQFCGWELARMEEV